MNRQQIRQAARRKALEGQESRRRQRAATDSRLESLAVDVLVAVAERDEAIQEAEQRAGVAVLTMQEEGLSASAVAQWCGNGVSAREVRRLAHGVAHDSEAAQKQEEIGASVARAPVGGQDAMSQEQRAG